MKKNSDLYPIIFLIINGPWYLETVIDMKILDTLCTKNGRLQK